MIERPLYYVLDPAGEPVPMPDVIAWGWWMHTADRHAREDTIGTVRISTVFLGLDHAFTDDRPPVLWETMIFRGVMDGYQRRYTTREAAIAGHTYARHLVRCTRELPRRSKKAFRKWWHARPLGPWERVRVGLALRVAA